MLYDLKLAILIALLQETSNRKSTFSERGIPSTQENNLFFRDELVKIINNYKNFGVDNKTLQSREDLISELQSALRHIQRTPNLPDVYRDALCSEKGGVVENCQAITSSIHETVSTTNEDNTLALRDLIIANISPIEEEKTLSKYSVYVPNL